MRYSVCTDLSVSCKVGRRIQEVNVMGGLILPIWGSIEKALSKQVIPLQNFSSTLSLVLARRKLKSVFIFCAGTSKPQENSSIRTETTADNQRIV